MFFSAGLLFLLASLQGDNCQEFLNTPPRVEIRPLLLDSFIPAGMQIIAYVTERMKYDSGVDMATQSPASTTAPSTVKPTRPHGPGIFQPDVPPGPDFYFAKNGLTYEEYVERLKYPTGQNYFNHLYNHRRSLDREDDASMFYSNVYGDMSKDLDRFFSREAIDLLKLINRNERIDDDDDLLDANQKVDDFVRTFDDSSRLAQVRKPIKEVKAYVSLLSLYEELNKESKILKLNKYSGYTENVLKVLVETSTGTSANQLRSVLGQIVDRMDTKNPKVMKKILLLITDLETAKSSVNNALKLIPPLKFVP